MTVTPAYYLSLSLSYLKAMIGDSQVWRAMVAQPDTDWTSLQTLIDAATSPEAAALAKIVEGRFEDDADHDDYVTRPRALLRHFDENAFSRISTSGFGLNGIAYVAFEYPIPSDYTDSAKDAYTDAENKIGGVIEDLAGMARVSGYLDLNEIHVTAFGQADPDENNGEEFYIAELVVHHRGVTP